MDIVKSLKKTVVSVFHELNLACAYCDYIYVVDKGKIVAHGKPSEILTSELLADTFRILAEIIVDKEGKPHIIYKKALINDYNEEENDVKTVNM